MTTTKKQLSAKEIQNQKNYAQKYLALINKELSYGDLINLENVKSYTESYKRHSELAVLGYVEIPTFA